ncbi:TolC family protein [Algoriphagus hitonicola]|uniref:Outer membrane factor, OMF family n=1 Tax=Algoriphagus hitonicola TaxID=435880 RepID=A0A1I2VM36_9BACT|nr:TolC family protein [Algoriphagus hitonicola]SFG90190.1 outer membrane factor, OMF family [Algoriphagus hitonicola]
MLVNTHKQILFSLFLFFLVGEIKAQEWTLQQSLDTAMVHNRTLQVAQNQVAVGDLKNQESKSQLLPKVMATADYKYFTQLPYQILPQAAFGGPEGVYRAVQFGVPHTIMGNLNLRMPIYDPQVMAGIQISESFQELSEWQRVRTEEQIHLEVSNLYYNAQILKNQRAFLQANQVNGQKLERNVRLLYEQKLAIRTDLDKVILQNQQLESQIFQLESQYATILQQLKLVIGLPLDRAIEVESAVQIEESGIPNPSLTSDLRIQELQEKMIAQELKAIKKSRIPSVSFVANYGTTGFGYNGSPKSFLDFYPQSFLGAQVSFPIFNGTVTSKKISQKELELNNASIQKSLIADQTQVQYEAAMRQQATAKKQIQITQSQITLAESIYDKSILLQQEGLATLTDILLADQSLRTAQQAYLDAMVEYLKATLELKKSSATLLD